jgi:polysaccharide biosynthesis protein PslG
MTKRRTTLLALTAILLVAAGAALVAFTRIDANAPAEVSPAAALLPPVARAEPMVVGFLDDASFRWHPERAQLLGRARATGARLVRVLVAWHVVAPARPAPGALPYDEPLMHDLDELVARAESRGMELLFTIWGTPPWANGGLPANHAPTDLDALRDFARGVAARYPAVRRYSVWNEPNTELFFAPQFDEAGRSVSPAAYARVYRATYDGIKAANPRALVGIGETSSHGRDAPVAGSQDRHSPARFAELLSRERPRLEFDAWAHHPYPVQRGGRPDGLALWPAVTLLSLDRFASSLSEWFGRAETPLWITEFAYEAAPADPGGIPEDVQAEYAARAIELAAKMPNVELFVWFTFADYDGGNPWQSGLLDAKGAERPLYGSFSGAVREFAAS